MQARRLRIHEFDDHAPEPVVEFTMPEDLSGLTIEELVALEATAVEAFDALYADGEATLTPEQVVDLRALGDAIKAIRAAVADREAAAQEARDEAAALAAELRGEVTPEEPEAPEVEAPVVAEDATPEAEPVPVAASDAVIETTATEVPAPAVAASVARTPIRVPLGRIRDRAPAPDVPSQMANVVITAAADIAGVSPGSRFTSLDDVGLAMHERAKRLGNGHEAPVATIENRYQHVVTARMSEDEVQAVIAAATSVDALLASGGWCTPSPTIYDLFAIEGVDGLVDVPSITIERGGINHVVDGGPSIANIFSTNQPWSWTETQDLAAATGSPTKPCYVIPCPTWDEDRLEMLGICLTHGNLSNAAYPELTRRYISLLMSAHEHRLNYLKLASMVANSTAETTTASAFGCLSAVLGSVSLVTADFRDKYRMTEGSTLEVVFPRWLRQAIKSDLARRPFADQTELNNAQIDALFANRGARVQWVTDWQPLATGTGAVGANPALSWPTTVQYLIYPAGVHVFGRGPTIDLGVVRDSTLNETNDYTAAWTEDAWLMSKMGHESRVVTAAINPSGAVGIGTADATPIA